jgi:hypothetical protein
VELEELSQIEIGENGIIEEIEPPAPGIYYDMPAAQYHKIRGASASRLKILRRSPAHLHYAMLHPAPPTEAMVIGSAVHCRVLEPDRFSREYAIMPKFDRRTKIGKEAAAHFEIENMGKQICGEETAIICEMLYDSLHANPIVSRLLDAPGNVEASIFWEDPETGIRCKARADKLLEIGGEYVTLDLKTTIHAGAGEFARQAFNLGYHIQSGFYLDGLTQTLGIPHSDFIFLAAEKEPPFAFASYRLDDESVGLGRTEYKFLLDLWKSCEEKQEWPSYSNEIQSLALPAWAYKI